MGRIVDENYEPVYNDALTEYEKEFSKEGFANEMRRIRKINDPEQAHALADNLMCKTLRKLGYGLGIDIFAQMDKWYS